MFTVSLPVTVQCECNASRPDCNPTAVLASSTRSSAYFNTSMKEWIYYEANEASASGPHHLGGPHQNFNAVSNVELSLRKKSLNVNLL